MPLYEYRCDECSNTFEELVLASSSPSEVACPRCRSVKVSRQMSTFAAHGLSSRSSSGLSGGEGGGSSCPPGCGGNCSCC